MFPTKQGTGGLRVPLVSFTGRDPYEYQEIRSYVEVFAALFDPKWSTVEGLIFVWYFLSRLPT